MVRRILLILMITGLIASVGVWVASYCFWQGISVGRYSPQSILVIAAMDGRIAVTRLVTTWKPVDESMATSWFVDAMSSEGALWFAPRPGLNLDYHPMPPHFVLTIPIWLIVMPFAVVLGLLSIPWWRRLRRRWRGCCLDCGYDLTGNVSGACPECGADVAVSK